MATFDLQSGASHKPNPNDFITKAAACHVAPAGTAHPAWTAFLERIAPDPDLRAFLKRFCGYCLTGTTSEHKFVYPIRRPSEGRSR